eukprot:7639523-Ditylum_brightwellii.AAC.1
MEISIKKEYANPDPCKIFYKDFNKFITQNIGKDKEIIIGIDANKVDAPGSDLQKFCTVHKFVNVFTYMHSNLIPPHTYQRSDNRLDCMFVMPSLIPSITGVVLLPFNVLFCFNHGSMYVDFDKELLLLG